MPPISHHPHTALSVHICYLLHSFKHLSLHQTTDYDPFVSHEISVVDSQHYRKERGKEGNEKEEEEEEIEAIRIYHLQ